MQDGGIIMQNDDVIIVNVRSPVRSNVRFNASSINVFIFSKKYNYLAQRFYIFVVSVFIYLRTGCVSYLYMFGIMYVIGDVVGNVTG